MTSYANDTTTSAAAATSAGAVEAAATTAAVTAPQSAVGGVAAPAAADSSKVKGRDNLSISRTQYGDEDGNSSDGREKADTTPENIKKIAEIMDSPDGTMSANSPIPSPRHVQLRNPMNPGFVGLGAAIDEPLASRLCTGGRVGVQGSESPEEGSTPPRSSCGALWSGFELATATTTAAGVLCDCLLVVVVVLAEVMVLVELPLLLLLLSLGDSMSTS